MLKTPEESFKGLQMLLFLNGEDNRNCLVDGKIVGCCTKKNMITLFRPEIQTSLSLIFYRLCNICRSWRPRLVSINAQQFSLSYDMVDRCENDLSPVQLLTIKERKQFNIFTLNPKY